MAPEADPSAPLTVAHCSWRHDTLRNQRFPDGVRTHRQVAGTRPFDGDGVFFSTIRGRMDDDFGIGNGSRAPRVKRCPVPTSFKFQLLGTRAIRNGSRHPPKTTCRI